MAGAISDYLEDALMKHLFRNTPYTAGQTWVALFTANPTDAGGGTEVSGGGYARQRVFQDGSTAPFWTAPAESGEEMQVKNNSAITFPQATAAWGTVTGVGIFDASTAGNLLWWGALTSSKTVDINDTFSFAANALVVGLD
jgi:hypothetical protein